MSEVYNSAVSAHYAAYRPPLHQMILRANLELGKLYQCGLDIGCGTGVSTVALSEFCIEVHGVDPSKAMINQAAEDERISYHIGSGESIPLGDKLIDIVTFAGSLSYTKSSSLVSELRRVCSTKADIIVYDFEVLLNGFFSNLGIEMGNSSSNYDHAINFSDCSEFNEQNVHTNTIELEINSEQLAHVLFSSSRRYSCLIDKFGSHDTFASVVEKLNMIGLTHRIKVDTYYSMYQIKG